MTTSSNIKDYVFDKTAKTITFLNNFNLRIEGFQLITNAVSNLIIFQFNDPLKGGTLVGNVLTLDYDTSAMLNTDALIINYSIPRVDGATLIDNTQNKLRDAFETLNSNDWDTAWTNQGVGQTSFGGNSFGSSYLRVNLDPTKQSSEFILTSKNTFKFPFRFGFGLSLSQRIIGQEISMELVGVNSTTGAVAEMASVPLIPILGTIVSNGSALTVNTTLPHGLRGGDRVCLVGNAEARLNVGPVVVTVLTAYQFTVPSTLASATYTAGGNILWADPFNYASNAVGVLASEIVTATSLYFGIRKNSGSFRTVNASFASTSAIQSNTSSYTDAFNSSMDTEIVPSIDEVFYSSRTNDSIATPAIPTLKYTQNIPDEAIGYKIRLRFKQLPNFVNIGASIATITKTGTTTATVVTATPHGLLNGQFVQIYGVRDQANFPNLSSATIILVNATTFTILIGTATTTNSVGGIVCLNNGSILLPGALGVSIQSIQRTANILTVITNTTATGLLPGEYCYLGGMDAGGAAYIGMYKVLRMSSSTYELESIGADFALITCGGAVVKLTDCRLHYVRMMDYTRNLVEVSNARGNIDLSKAMPVQGTVVIGSGTITTVSTVSSVSSVTTVSTVANLTNMNTIDAREVVWNGWADMSQNLLNNIIVKA